MGGDGRLLIIVGWGGDIFFITGVWEIYFCFGLFWAMGEVWVVWFWDEGSHCIPLPTQSGVYWASLKKGGVTLPHSTSPSKIVENTEKDYLIQSAPLSIFKKAYS